jgi:hypothetical protein
VYQRSGGSSERTPQIQNRRWSHNRGPSLSQNNPRSGAPRTNAIGLMRIARLVARADSPQSSVRLRPNQSAETASGTRFDRNFARGFRSPLNAIPSSRSTDRRDEPHTNGDDENSEAVPGFEAGEEERESRRAWVRLPFD